MTKWKVGICLLLTLVARPVLAAEVKILTGSDSMDVAVDLKPLEPLSPALRAILALYAIRANGGCPPGEVTQDSYKMRCPLTTALGLGDQCSAEEIALVEKWFKDGVPVFKKTGGTKVKLEPDKDLGQTCNNTPYTATHQSIWQDIRVRSLPDKQVKVTASGSWTAGPEAGSGSFTFVTTYRILPDRVKVVSHKGDVRADS